MRRTIVMALAAIALLLIPVVWAISTTTQVNFIISSVVAYTLTLPSETPVDANATGAPTTAIEFTSATGTDSNINAKVSGGAWQNSTVPIFEFDNTGTVNLNISVVLNQTTQPCITFTGNTTYSGADAGFTIATSAVTVVNNFQPADPAQAWYMKADFAACTTGDTSTRTLTSNGVQS